MINLFRLACVTLVFTHTWAFAADAHHAAGHHEVVIPTSSLIVQAFTLRFCFLFCSC